MRVGSQGTGWPGTAGSGQLPKTKGGEAGKGSSKSAPDKTGGSSKSAPGKTGQEAPSKDVSRKDVFETAPRQPPRDLFGQAPRLPSQPAVILPPGGQKNLDEPLPNCDPSATRKPGVSLQDVHALLVNRELLNRALINGRVPDEDFMDRMAERDLMDGALEGFDPAFIQKARTEGGQHSPVAGGPVTIIPVDNLGGPGLTTDSRPPLTAGQGAQNLPPGGGGSGIGPRPGQGGTLLQPGQGGGLVVGGDAGGGVHPPNQKGNDGGKVSPNPNPNPNQEPAGVRGGAKDTAPEPTNDDDDDDGGGDAGTGETKKTGDSGGTGVDVKKGSEGEGLPQGDESSRGKAGDDCRPRGLPPPARVSRQELDLVGPAIGTTTGPDDKERPNTGGTSGSQAGSDDLDDDIGGPAVSSLRKGGGGGEAGPLWKDLRVLNPNDPSKV